MEKLNEFTYGFEILRSDAKIFEVICLWVKVMKKTC